MNQWLLDRYTSSHPPPRLERLCSGRAVSIVLAHDQQSVQPLWLLKTSTDSDGIKRLRTERDALHYLQPWARELGIPEVLEWSPAGPEVCLVRSVMPGEVYPVRLKLSASQAQLEGVFRRPLDWLKRFRARVTPPAAQTVGDLVAPLCRQLIESTEASQRALGEFLAGDPASVNERPAVVIHGDFFPPNVMLGSDGQLSVVDWDHFGNGIPFRDEMNLLVGSNFVTRSGRAWDVDEIWRAMMFSPYPIAKFLRDELAVADPELRFYSYAYLAWQAVQGAPVERRRWRRTLDLLAPHGFPGPGSGLSGLAQVID